MDLWPSGPLRKLTGIVDPAVCKYLAGVSKRDIIASTVVAVRRKVTFLL
jgi:hypothetical protein